jgi:hypothetical protein
MSNVVIIIAVVILSECTIYDVLSIVKHLFGWSTALRCWLLEFPGSFVCVWTLQVEPSCYLITNFGE